MSGYPVTASIGLIFTRLYRSMFLINWLTCGSSHPGQIGFGDVGFCGKKKTGESREKHSDQRKK